MLFWRLLLLHRKPKDSPVVHYDTNLFGQEPIHIRAKQAGNNGNNAVNNGEAEKVSDTVGSNNPVKVVCLRFHKRNSDDRKVVACHYLLGDGFYSKRWGLAGR